MCLKSQKKVKQSFATDFVGVGYKIFRRTYGSPPYASEIKGNRTYNWNQWYYAELKDIYSDDDKLYPAGFHIWKTKRGAKAWGCNNNGVCCKVEYKYVLTIGKQAHCSCVVAAAMRIIKEVEL